MIVNVNNVASPIDRTKPAAGAPANADALQTDSGKQAPPTGKEAPVSEPMNFERTVAQLEAFISNTARGLRFHIDKSSGRTVVTVVNPNNGEVIRQIPSEEVLHLANELRQFGTVNLLDEQA
jgi:flagellar protein FlaG